MWKKSGKLGELRQREREMGVDIAQLQHVNELCYVIECEDVSNAFVKKVREHGRRNEGYEQRKS